MSVLHKKEVDEYSHPTVLSWCAVRTYGITACPLCSIEGPQDAPDLVDHVLHHTYDFALLSLPGNQSATEDQNMPMGTYNFTKGQDGSDKLMEWFQKSSSSVEDDVAKKLHLSTQHTPEDSLSADPFNTEETDDFNRDDYIKQAPVHESFRRHVQNRSSSSLSECTDNGEDLTDRLLRELVESPFDRKEFFPNGCIDRIITPETVAATLNAQADQRRLAELVDFASQESKTIFAILLCCDLNIEEIHQALRHFKSIRIDDSKLPVIGNDTKLFFFTERTYQKPWTRLRVRHFCSNQWKFLAPIFQNGQRELSLHSDQVLPFLAVNQRGNPGMFGEVYQVTIHPGHIKRAINSTVAVKKLHRSYSEDEATQDILKAAWEKEVDAHKQISQFNSPNIIRFMTAFTRGHERFFMFEWADGGNLRDFWTKYTSVLTESLVRDVILQFHGLADALDKMHSMNYRHGDMKPENILRVNTIGQKGSSYLDVGTLKICDMGLSKKHTMATRLRDVATTTMFTSWRYEPPESKEENAIWPRRYDIWSIGCIILEFIVWLVNGPSGLDKFNKEIVNEFGAESHYFERENRSGVASYKVHGAVIATMETLSRHPECEDGATALGDLLKVVRTRLLVVALKSGKFGKETPFPESAGGQVQTRADAVAFKTALEHIIRKGKERPTYWIRAKHASYLQFQKENPDYDQLAEDIRRGQAFEAGLARRREGKELFFFYGTLMDPDIVQEVLGLPERPVLKPALLRNRGHMRMWGPYPAFLADQEPRVDVKGMACEIEGTERKDRLATYEGDKYNETKCFVNLVTEGGETDLIVARVMASEYDIIIIGSGPAGLSAAASIVRQDHTTLLFDSGKYRNAKTNHMHTVPSWDDRGPAEFRAASPRDLERYGTVTVEHIEVERIKQNQNGIFEATAAGKTWTGKKVILATGVEDVFPNIPSYTDCWVSGIFHCPYCHGWEERGNPSAGMLAEGDTGNVVVALHFARQALRLAKQVTLYTNGNEQLTKQLADALTEAPAPMTIDSKIKKLVKGPERSQIELHFHDNTSKTEAFLAHKPKTKLRGSLAERLGLELTPPGIIKVNPPFHQTSLKGVFAAGDFSSPMQTITAAFHSGTCTGGGAPLQIQAETLKQKAIF
ncbi:hypothetical protein N8I77_005003 [Diaporthe amygdali]|uniref:Protein kinase domain-containing protein n=1 Tax=Phomopsis amygdali TaxID=1214568 RepID=A0AAD9SMI7_PHOAM|nr:hypothetical protein N8I77_005003 [Diaporthe amygdali]